MPARALAEMRRDMARLRLIEEQIAEVEGERLRRLEDTRPEYRPTDAMVRQLARVVGLGIETADMLVHEIFTRDLRDRRAVARYAGLTGSPDESGSRRRERGLSRAGNARVRRGMVQLAWRFLVFQKDSALVRWYRERTADGRGRTRMASVSRTYRRKEVRCRTRDEGRSLEAGGQAQASNRCKPRSLRAMVVSVAETSGQDPGR